MKGLVTLCSVISWTVICGAVLAQNEVDYESDKSQDELEELSRLLKEEELFKTNLKRIYDTLNDEEKKDDEEGEETWETCEDGKLKCPTKTSKCAGDPNTFYCACKDGYKPKSGNEINNKEGCVEYEECLEKLRCNKDTTKCNTEDEDNPKCECLEGFKEVRDGEGNVDTERCIDEYECKGGDCDGENQKCVPKGNDYYCDCNEHFELVDKDKKGTKNIQCKAIPYTCKTGDCPGANTQCIPFENTFKCECLKDFEPVDESKKDKTELACKAIPYTCKTGDCPGANTQCIPFENTFKCECLKDFEPVDESKKDKTELACKAITYTCKTGDCPGANTQCIPIGKTFKCECLEDFEPEDVGKKDTKELVCKEKIHECKETDCSGKNTKCVAKGNKYTCECKDDFKPKDEAKKGQKDADCIAKNKCELGKYTCPMPERAKCVMKENDDYYCECLEGFVPEKGEVKDNKGKCISGCDNGYCKLGSTCKPLGLDYECICPPFFEGKNCTQASCAKNPCKNNGKCEVKEKDKDKKAECICKLPYTGILCETNSWCEKKICGTSEVECKFSVEFGAGYCQCKNETLRFNYAKQVCEEKPVCSYMTCKKNEKCDSTAKKCVCKDGYKLDEESQECKSELCKDTCFSGSTCSEIGNDAIKCSCNSSQYFVNNKCEDASCLLQNLRSNCKQDCPLNMKREGGICKPVKSDEAKTPIPCGLSCGPYGYCFKGEAEDAKETCVCIQEAKEVVTEDKTVCELKKESVCPSGVELTKDKTKCNCTGKYKESANKITCELKTCSDKDVQDECKKRNADCVMDWKNGGGYDCKCKDGYDQDPNSKICFYKTNILSKKLECSKDSKVAFMDQSNNIRCMCPPGIITVENTPCTGQYEDKTTYLINNLPVSKTKYVHDSVVDVFALTKDIILAMQNTFKNLQFARLFKYSFKDDVINCSVWLQFKIESEFDYNRIPMAAFEDGLLLPGLQLKKEKIKEVKGDKLKFCSGQEHDPFCGATTCDKKECKCREGYRIVDSSIKKYGDQTILHCEDVNECIDGSHTCPQDTTSCVNTEGSFYCKCLQNYKLKKDQVEDKNQEGCIDACKDPNPCTDGQGQCSLTSGGMIDCSCNVGFSGSYCNKEDVTLAGANKKTVIVGAVLGTFLGILIIAVIAYVIKQRKNSHSEDFSPAPRLDNAEMTERRPMRGISNRAYQ